MPSTIPTRTTSGPPGTLPSSGPLALLETSAYDFTGYTYPLDLGSNPQRGHSIIFYIDAQNGSSYLQSGAQSIVVDNNDNPISSTAATNLTNDQTQQQLFSTLVQNGGSASKLSLSGGTSRITQAIALYMPDTVNFVYDQSYDTPSMTDEFGSLGLGAAALGTLNKSGDLQKLLETGAIPKASALFNALSLPTAEVLAKELGVSGSTLGILGATVGIAINPQLQVIFKGTGLRTFQYEFRFAPTSSQEAQAVQNIIQLFRFHQAPEIAISGAGRYFIPPSQFDISMLFNGQINPALPKISTCVLTNVNIDYGASGNWATFTDGSPIDIRMILQFMEIEIMTKLRISQGY